MQSTKDLLNILSRIKNFEEFEKELANISSDKEKGDLFELFCQIYLKVIYKKQTFKSIQLFKDVDPTTLNKLNLRISKDYGIDIVAITNLDEIWTIQVKFRQSDQLTWTELSTFKASSENAAFSMVMSNVGKINHPHKILSNFSSILRNEFEVLTEEDFSNIKSALKGQIIKPVIFLPRPHQIEAIKAAINHFKINNQGQMIHACGTGKTLTSLWIKEAIKPKNTIVYVPSLSLLKQTLEEWTKHKSSNFSIKCVCSDQSVSTTAKELDETIVDVTELGVPVTTNPKEIIEFLKSSEKDKIIFSTYQSAPVILEAIKDLPKFSFDFGVFDEAHRTASKSEHLFTKSLNTPIQKKMFMTATPKLYAPHLKSRAKEEDILLCSMDDTAIYGEVFHEIKFGDAIKLNLLSDYKIKVIVVSNNDIKELIDRRYWLNILGKEITADDLAKVWALLRSLDEANHIISFHSRIHNAKEFQILVEKTIELLKLNKKEVVNVKTYHICGEYPTYQRSKILSEFINQKKSLVTNARCLTEGVDVPVIDGVYFVDPKQNLIDIVQAVGRAMRRKSTKYGYIIIPVFIKDETDVEHIIETSAFRQVWSVVQAMKDQDVRLSHVIEQLQELKGKKRFGSLSSRDQSEERALKKDLGNIFDLSDSILPKNIDIPSFIEHINLKTLEIVGQSWDERFGEYKAFKEKYGREPTRESKDIFENRLSYWVGTQRSWHNSNKLSKERIDKLNLIGFNWGIVLNKWDKVFEDYRLFRNKNNSEPVVNSKDKSEIYLANWAGSQRTNRKNGKLTADKLNKLNSIGFIWHIIENKWEQSFNDYQKFKQDHDREPVFKTAKGLERDLSVWAGDQRERYKANKLSKNRIDKLNSIGFSWDYKKDQWDRLFKDYQKFKKKYNREPFHTSKNDSENKIVVWVGTQKIQYNRNKLSQDRIDKLNSTGIIWDILETAWEQSFNDYHSFKKEHNREPSNKSKNNYEKNIGCWATRQRIEYNKNNLSQDRIDKLNFIGFTWDIKGDWWEQSFNAYVSFRKEHGREPLHTSKNKSEKDIALWVTRQRKSYKRNKLSQDRIERLNSIGFTWDIFESSWNQAFNDYQAFKEKYGREPSNSSKDESERFLAHWAGVQRRGSGRNRLPLSKDKVDKLNSIGFTWDIKGDQWEQSFKDYQEFKKENNREPSNHSKVKPENSLGHWTNNQRQNYKKKEIITQDHIDKLNSIGFKWSLKR